MAESRMRQVVAIRFFTRRRGGPTIRRMTGTGWTLALISVALAVGIALLDQLPRRVRVLVVFSVMGAVFGVLMLVGRTWERTCELSDPTVVDRCSGKYIELFGEHRLPQFMQT